MNQEFKTTTLYIKTHNKTGLKYFGKTTAKDPHKYKGSGKRWTNHIKKHGYDVITEIVGTFTDTIWLMMYALEFSEITNIVESVVWANLIPENGIDGGWQLSREVQARNEQTKRVNKTGIYNPNSRIKSNKIQKENKLGFYNPEIQAKCCIAAQSPEARRKQRDSLERIGHQQGYKNSQFGTMWVTNGIDSKRIKKEYPIEDGWRKGRTMAN